MHHFDYRGGILHAEELSIPEIARQVGTPFYCYSTATLERHYSVFSKAFANSDALVCYSIKSNSNLAVIKILADLGSGADIVSEGELRRALTAGIPAHKIVFSGVGKTSSELVFALEKGILQFNVESEAELERLNEIAQSRNTRAPISLRINPDVDAGSHVKISTGKSEDKFGIPWARARDVYRHASLLPGIDVTGIDVHIGSQITELDPFRAAFTKVAEMVETLRADGHAIQNLDLGGGLGIPYTDNNQPPPHPDEYAFMITKVAGHLGVRLIFEPGRMIVGNAGILVSSVIYTKDGDNRRFVIIDTAMNDLIRPTLYDAYHTFLPVKEADPKAPLEEVDIVGPVCETSDTFTKARAMPPLAADDLIAILSTGAYGAVQSSTYNSRLLIPEVLVNKDKLAIVRPRPTYEALLGLDQIPDWLKTS